jgi:hypothetical protein
MLREDSRPNAHGVLDVGAEGPDRMPAAATAQQGKAPPGKTAFGITKISVNLMDRVQSEHFVNFSYYFNRLTSHKTHTSDEGE